MVEDIVPGLLKEIQSEFTEEISRDAKIGAIEKRIAKGTATMADVHQYAARLGENLSAVLIEYLDADNLPDQTLYYNIADRIVRPMLEDVHISINDTAIEIQKIIDEASGIGLNGIRADFPKGRVHGLIDKMVEAGEDYPKWLGEPVINCTESFSDDYMKTNASFREDAGLKIKIVRTAEATACDWCKNLEGEYSYDDLPDEIYARHEFCRCDVTYISEKDRIRQNVWTKKTTAIDDRKNYGL